MQATFEMNKALFAITKECRSFWDLDARVKVRSVIVKFQSV